MARLTLTGAFASYGAKLRNTYWAVSDIAGGHLVVSLWAHKFRGTGKGSLAYVDHLSRWSGPGNALFREHLEIAFRDQLPVRAVIARCEDPDAVDRGQDASKTPKSFHIRPDIVGVVTEFDGDNFRIEFHRERPQFTGRGRNECRGLC